MSAILQQLTGEWSTTSLPTQTTLTHIDPTNLSGIVETLTSASAAYPTITKNIDLYNLARAVKGAKASLLVISAQNYIATATNTQQLPLMTQIIWNATMELQDLEMGFNLYQMKLSLDANAIFAALFAFLLVTHTGICVWKQYLYFGLCLAIGTALECAGYAARLLSIGHYSEKPTFLCQIISLTLAPAFVMAGVYYLLAQLLVIHGRKYSVLKPLWYSYIFIFCDISSLFIQAAGGGLAAIRLQALESTATGTHIMVAGIAFQVLSMTLFLGFFLDFLNRIYFKASPHVKPLFGNWFALFFLTRRGKEIRMLYLNQNYNRRFESIWSRDIFGYYPLAIFLCVFFIYVRCVYRLVELSEGWTGYLITHEEYVMTLDALQVLITCIILVPFHPGFIMGKGAKVSLSDISNKNDQEFMDNLLLDSTFTDTDSPYNEKYGGYRVDETSFSTPVHSPVMLRSPDTSHHRDLFESQPYNAQPYYVPHLPVERTSHRSTSSTASIPQPPQTPLGQMNQKKLRDSRDGKVNEDGLVAIPYDFTTETPSESVSDLPLRRPTNDKRASRGRKHSRTSSMTRSINPYERTIPEELATSGPYEQRYEPPRNPFSPPPGETDNDDLESQITHDEFFFSFGK